MINPFFPKRAIHLDFHTMPSPYDLSDEFDPEEFASTLQEAKVDYITVFARCNIGFAYYPTEIGTPHPALKKDMLGGMVESCHKRGIKVAAYFNAGLDHEHAIEHREWTKVDEQGRVIKIAEMGNFNRLMCYNTGYREHLLTMIEEVLDKYPVDGIFLDCITSFPCYGVECLDKMRAMDMDIYNPIEVARYAHIANQDFCDEVTRRTHAKVGDTVYIYYNGMPYRIQPTHLELEVLPTGGWGYDYLPFAIRYARSMGKEYFTMTGRFHRSWGDFGGLRSKDSMAYDLYYSLANCGTCSVGDHLHPRGKLEPAVYDMIGEVYTEIEKIEPWTYGSKPKTEILVLEPWLGDFPHELNMGGWKWNAMDPMRGAMRVLSELKQQFDLTDGSTDFSGYKVLVLPDSTTLTPQMQQRVQAFIDGGGSVICTGFGGFDKEISSFVLAPEAVKYEGPEPFDPTFFTAKPEVADGVPDMPNAVYLQAAAIEAGGDAKVLAEVIKPYDNVGKWDWNHEYFYTPPEKKVGRPAAIRTGNIIYVSFPMFAGYYAHAVPAHKALLKNLLEQLLPNPMIKSEGMPSFSQVTAAAGPKGELLVHLISYCPEARGMAQIIEEPINVHNVKIGVRKDGRQFSRAFLAPSQEELEIVDQGEYISIVVPEVNGHQLVVLE